MEWIKKSKSSRTAWLGMFLAFALILGYVESLLPFSFGIPGIKLGLANLAVVLALYWMGEREAFLLDVLRILLSGFLFGSLYSIFYSMAGGMLSFFAMLLLRRTGRFGMNGVSMAGGVLHNVGQLGAAALVVETGSLFYYMPPLLLSGLITGFLIGLVAGQVKKRIAPEQTDGIRRKKDGEP